MCRPHPAGRCARQSRLPRVQWRHTSWRKHSMSDLAEKDAIREVMAEYCFRLDNGRFADMAALFASDGTWDTAVGKGTGRGEIEALVRRIRGPGPHQRAIHHVTNIVI